MVVVLSRIVREAFSPNESSGNSMCIKILQGRRHLRFPCLLGQVSGGRFYFENIVRTIWYRAPKTSKWRKARVTSRQRVLVQRGQFRASVKLHANNRLAFYDAPILHKPLLIESTAAQCIKPTLRKATAGLLDFENENVHKDLALSVDTKTIILVPDKASGNCLFLKDADVKHRELIEPATDESSFLLVDTCSIHNHCRGQLAVPDIGYHIMRHASISHLDRVQHIHDEQLNLCSLAAHQRIVRIRGPPPRAPRLTYREVADNIYNFEGQWHRRKFEKESQMIQDIMKLADFCNGDMEDEDTWPIKHYCWDAVMQRPCCASEACSNNTICPVQPRMFYSCLTQVMISSGLHGCGSGWGLVCLPNCPVLRETLVARQPLTCIL